MPINTPDKFAHQDGLIDAIYEMALDPTKFESFTEAWDQYLQQQTSSDAAPPSLPENISAHFNRAFKILEKIGRVGTVDPAKIVDFLDHRSGPSLAVRTNGSVVSINKKASHLLGDADSATSVLTLFHSSSHATIVKGLQQVQTSDSSLPVLSLLPNQLPVFLMIQQVPESDCLVIDITGSSWDRQVTSTLQAMYSLTDRECEMASLLYQGNSVKNIAELEGLALETVRKHTKALLTKTATRTQAQLMRLLTSLNFSHTSQPGPDWTHSRSPNFMHRLDDGRRLAYYDTGGTQTKVVVVLHGLLHDPELPTSLHEALLKAGYRVIGMSRAWYGASDPPSDTDNILERSAADLMALLRALKLSKVTLLGSLAGGIHALVFAARYPEAVQQIINVAGVVPFRTDEQYQSMTRSLRSLVHTARYFPRLLPLLVRSAVALIDNGNIRKLFNSGYKSSPVDLAATRNPEIFARLSAGYRFAVHHGYSAYTYEGIAIAGDTHRYSTNTDCPITLVHGEADGLTSRQSVESFAKHHQNATLRLIAEGGNLIMYTHPIDVTNCVLTCLSDSHCKVPEAKS